MYANYNKCIEHSQGEWIVFLHSDDQFLIGALSIINRFCNAESRPDVVTSTCSYYAPLWESLGDVESFLLENDPGLILLSRYMGLNMPGACFSRKVLEYLGGFHDDSVIADYDLYLRLLRNGKKLLITHEPLIKLGTTERTTTRLIQKK
jgi:glycosyltransferase involved in cell wall biosynthesis